MNKNNWKGAGRKKTRVEKKSIIVDGKIVMPEIIRDDIGWELQMGWQYKDEIQERSYLTQKKTPWNV
tara:strand:+ start:998 stop:1198 length:201 start_codon:yes stop_codon:yes gene_type:complete